MRSNFGGADTGALAIQAPSGFSGVVKSAPNRSGSAWSAATGGTQYTDMLLVGGGASTVVLTDANGFVRAFQGPDGVNEGLWVDLGSGRFYLRTTDALSFTYVPASGTANSGTSAPKILREIADPNRTASKWREVVDASLWQGTHPDPVHFFGWNADKAAGGGGDAAEPALYMGFEADYYDSPTTRTMEWYVGVVRADSSGPQFRPFAFTAARDSNLDLSASVQIDIGSNANGSTRSQLAIVAGGPNLVLFTSSAVTIQSGVSLRKAINNTTFMEQRNAADTAWIGVALVDSVNNVVIAPGGGPTNIGGRFGINYASTALSMEIATITLLNGRISHNGKGTATDSGIFTQNVSGTNYHTLGVNTNDNSGALVVVPSDATLRGVVIRGRASQSANLFEAQDSASAIKASISIGGNLFLAGGVGFNGSAPIAKRATTADSTDLASVITLANALKADLVAYGLKS